MRPVAVLLLNAMLLVRGLAAPHVHDACESHPADHSSRQHERSHFHLSFLGGHSHSATQESEHSHTDCHAQPNQNRLSLQAELTAHHLCGNSGLLNSLEPETECPCHDGDVVYFSDETIDSTTNRLVDLTSDSVPCFSAIESFGATDIAASSLLVCGPTGPSLSAAFLFLPHVLRI